MVGPTETHAMSPDNAMLVIGNRNYSSWSLRAWFYLSVIGLEFETERLSLDTPSFDAVIDDLSPTRRVPVLHLDDEIIWDSLAICEEVADRFAPQHGYPAQPKHRALARSAVAEIHSGFPALRAQMPMNCRASGRSVPMTDDLQHDIFRVCHIWRENLARHRAEGPWLFGEFSIADAFYAPVTSRFFTYGVDVGQEERSYMATVLEHPMMEHWYEMAHEETESIESEEFGR
jgi:glutathione S-transferase